MKNILKAKSNMSSENSSEWHRKQEREGFFEVEKVLKHR